MAVANLKIQAIQLINFTNVHRKHKNARHPPYPPKAFLERGSDLEVSLPE